MYRPRVLVACEYSGTVRNAFTKAGCIAVSCDLEPTESIGRHYQGDVLHILRDKWDLMVAHPPCTHLAVSGAKWFNQKQELQEEALEFVKKLFEANVPRICIENPISIISTRIKKPTQIIEPYMFGHREKKATCLWLKNLPRLRSTNIVYGQHKDTIHRNVNPGKNRGKERSKTFEGIATAMANQWTSYIRNIGLN